MARGKGAGRSTGRGEAADKPEAKKLDFKAIMKMTPEEFPEEQRIPEGTYRARGMAAKGQEDKGKVLLTWKLLEAQDDVDADELAAYVKGTDWENEARAFDSRFATRSGEVRSLINLLGRLGVKTQGRPFEDILAGFKGVEAFIAIAHKPNEKDPERPFVNVTKVIPVDEA